MSMTGVLRPGFAQIRVLDMEKALEHYTKRVGLHEVTRGGDGRVYLKAADEFDHHSLVLREADRAGIDVAGFKVASEADLDALEKRVSTFGYPVEHVPAGEQPGLGRRIGFTVCTGHRIELYAHADFSDPKPPTHNPDVWDVEPHGMRVRRFDHVLLLGPDIDRVLDFFEKALDFRCTERVDTPDGVTAIFLSCGMKAHDIAFVKFGEPAKLHHVSFELESWADIGHAADIITRYDISHDIGPTRHGLTQGRTIYFFDPSGNRNEVFTGDYTYYPDNPTRTWDETQIGKGLFYYERQAPESFLSVAT